MGGCVNVFLRDKDRNFHRMTRWTNTLPSFLDCIGNVENEDKHLREYMDPWLDMQKDWKENRKSKNFEHNMTPVYFPSPTRICRSEYGLVFVDYITKTIVSYQDYTSVGNVGLTSIVVSYDDSEREHILKIANAGKISYQLDLFNPLDIRKVKDANHMKEIIQAREGNYTQFIIDNSPWNIINCGKYKKFSRVKLVIDQILNQ